VISVAGAECSGRCADTKHSAGSGARSRAFSGSSAAGGAAEQAQGRMPLTADYRPYGLVMAVLNMPRQLRHRKGRRFQLSIPASSASSMQGHAKNWTTASKR